MRVKKLIEELQKLPQDAKVKIIYDGEPRKTLGATYLARNGKVMLAGYDDEVYSEEARPSDAPDFQSRQVWKTPKST